MERKIGEIFEYNGEWYQCVYNIHGNCDGCSFSHINSFEYGSVCCESYLVDIHGKCGKVIFKKLEKVGEPYPNAGKLYQLYKLPMNIEKLPPHTEGINLVRFDMVEIELRQTKEDMEKKNMETSNLKPFNLEAAKAGKPVCTRDGRKVRIICFDGKGDNPIIALVEAKGNKDALIEKVERYFINGHSVFEVRETNDDLMMLPEKKERWINVYKERCYETKEEAIRHIAPGTHYIDTIRVEWEDKE